MEIRVTITEIDYGDAVCKALALLRDRVCDDGSAASKIRCVATQLPDQLICSVVDAVSPEDKSQVLVRLIRENREKFLEMISGMLKKNGIDVELGELAVTEELTVTATVQKINYTALAEKFFPLLRRHLVAQSSPAATMLAALLKLPGMLVRGALERIPLRKKEEMIADLVNRYQDTILEKAMELAENNGVRIRLDNLHAEVL